MNSILIIENNLDICENTAELLELAGYHVIKTNNGNDGIEHAHVSRPDLILCDIMMPRMDGYGVLSALRDFLDVSKTPFVFLTAKSENDDIKKGIDLGACAYIVKPFANEELLKVVAEKIKKTILNNVPVQG